jgi:C4-dicarboxylate transporter DctM subunit
MWNAKLAISTMTLLLGGIYTGLFTPIEAAEVTAFYTIGLGLLVTRTMRIKDIWEALVKTMIMSGTLLILVAIATSFGRLITLYELPEAIGAAFAAFTDDPKVLLLCISGLLLFTGVWAETFSMIVVLTPVFLPVIAKLGIDPIQFGVVFVVCCEIGFLTPPFGCNLFVAMKLADQPIEAIFKSVLPFILTYVVILLVLIWFPSISLFLPKLLYG